MQYKDKFLNVEKKVPILFVLPPPVGHHYLLTPAHSFHYQRNNGGEKRRGGEGQLVPTLPAEADARSLLDQLLLSNILPFTFSSENDTSSVEVSHGSCHDSTKMG